MTVRYEYKKISVDECISRFADLNMTEKACQCCPNYGKTWNCPPFPDGNPLLNGNFHNMYVALMIVTKDTEDSFADVRDFDNATLEYRDVFARRVLALEKRYGGKGFLTIGRCRLCNECSRIKSMPCRYPEQVRPSLESVGIDLGKLSSELFSHPLSWDSNPASLSYLFGYAL